MSLVGFRSLVRERPGTWGADLRVGLRALPKPHPEIRITDILGTKLDQTVAPPWEAPPGSIRGARALGRILQRMPLDLPVVSIDAHALDAYEATLRSAGYAPATARKATGRIQALILAWQPLTKVRGRLVGKVRRPRVDAGVQVSAAELGVVFRGLSAPLAAVFALLVGADFPATKLVTLLGAGVAIDEVPAWGRDAVRSHAEGRPPGMRLFHRTGLRPLSAESICQIVRDHAASVLGRPVTISDLRAQSRRMIEAGARAFGSREAARKRLFANWKIIDRPPSWARIREGGVDASGTAVDGRAAVRLLSVDLAREKEESLARFRDSDRALAALSTRLHTMEERARAPDGETARLAAAVSGLTARLHQAGERLDRMEKLANQRMQVPGKGEMAELQGRLGKHETRIASMLQSITHVGARAGGAREDARALKTQVEALQDRLDSVEKDVGGLLFLVTIHSFGLIARAVRNNPTVFALAAQVSQVLRKAGFEVPDGAIEEGRRLYGWSDG